MGRTATVILLGLLAAGCATSGTGSGSSAPGSTTAAPPPSTPSTTPSSPLPSPPPEPTGTVRINGVVERGVAPGCLVLRSRGKSYTLLQGPDATPASGVPLAVPVEVEGRVLTGVASYCQQGTLLKVIRVVRT